MNKLAGFLQNATIGQPQTHGNMKVYPLFVQNGHERGYQTLDEAMSAKAIEIREVSEGGSVPTLAVRNTGKLPVLLVVGEQLVGAKQNRVLNTSLLVPAESEMQIPVSCVERGRWAYKSNAFDSSVTTSHLKLRKVQTENVTANLRSKARYDAEQGAVWQEVERKISSHHSTSSTRALNDVYEQTEAQLQGYLGAFTPPEKAQGVLVEINGQIVGGDLFDHEETLHGMFPKLIRGYALDALERQAQAPAKESITDTQKFLVQVQQAVEEVYNSVGLGEDVRLSSKEVTGSGLLWEKRLVHASLFSAKV